MNQKFFNCSILMLAAFIFVSCQQQQRDESAETDANRRKEVVRVMELQPQTITRSVEYPGNLEPFEEVHLAPASPGRIESIFANVGDWVSSGTTLVQMDRTQLHQAEIQLKNLEADFRRLDTLAGYGSIPRQQYEQLQSQYEVAKSNVEFLRDNTRLQAPFNGVISGRYYEPGEMYSGAPNPMTGKAAVLSIVQIDRMRAMVSVSEGYFPQIKNGMETAVKVDIYPGQVFSGRIYRIHPAIDPANRTFSVEVLIENREGLLRPGMFSRITFNLGQEEAVLLPSMAVLKMQGSNERFLFVEENGTARRVSVTVGKRYDDQVEVFSDELKPGARVIVTGQSRLLDGVPLEIVD
jgi:membrane fusion protein, multidrug efflux system